MVAVKSSDLLKRHQAGLISANVTPLGVMPPRFEFRLERKQNATVASAPIDSLMRKSSFVVEDVLSPGGSGLPFLCQRVTARMIAEFFELVYGFRVQKI